MGLPIACASSTKSELGIPVHGPEGLIGVFDLDSDLPDAFTEEDAWGPTGYLAEKGLIPLPEDERAAVRAQAVTMDVMELSPS